MSILVGGDPGHPPSAGISAAAVIAHPQADQVPLALGLRVIDKCRAAVPQGPVVDKLHLPRLEVEIDRQPVFFNDVKHRGNCRCTFVIDRLAPECVAAVDLVNAEPRLQFSEVLKHRCGKNRTFASVKFALPVEPERLVEPRQFVRMPQSRALCVE